MSYQKGGKTLSTRLPPREEHRTQRSSRTTSSRTISSRNSVSRTPSSRNPASRAPSSTTPSSRTPSSITPSSRTPVSSTPASSTFISGTPSTGTPSSGISLSRTPSSRNLSSRTPSSIAPSSRTPGFFTPSSTPPVSRTPSSSRTSVSRTSVSSTTIYRTSLSGTPVESKKSVLIAYLLWLFGGFFGLHHFYLRRDGHAFIWCCTLGGFFGLGWFNEILLIPDYVREVNESASVRRLPGMHYTEFSIKRVIFQCLMGGVFGHVCKLGIPKHLEEHLKWCIPLSISYGVWLVGNIGQESGVWWHTGLAACLIFYYRFNGDCYDLMLISMISSFVFLGFSRQCRPQRRRSCFIRFIRFIIPFGLYLGLWFSFFYYKAIIPNGPDDTISFKDLLDYFLQTKWWKRYKFALAEIWKYGNTYGWRKVLEYDEGFGVGRGLH